MFVKIGIHSRRELLRDVQRVGRRALAATGQRPELDQEPGGRRYLCPKSAVPF
jgi:hypothetical protein